MLLSLAQVQCSYPRPSAPEIYERPSPGRTSPSRWTTSCHRFDFSSSSQQILRRPAAPPRPNSTTTQTYDPLAADPDFADFFLNLLSPRLPNQLIGIDASRLTLFPPSRHSLPSIPMPPLLQSNPLFGRSLATHPLLPRTTVSPTPGIISRLVAILLRCPTRHRLAPAPQLTTCLPTLLTFPRQEGCILQGPRSLRPFSTGTSVQRC